MILLTILLFAALVLAGPVLGFTFYKLRHRFTGALPPWHPACEASAPGVWPGVFLAAAPWFVLLGFTMPFTVISEPSDPSYMPYTSAWFIVALLVFLPASSLTNLLGVAPLSGVHWLVCASWAALLSGAIGFGFRRRARKAASAR